MFKQRLIKSVKLKAQTKFVKAGKEATAPDRVVDEIVAIAQMVKAQLEAEKKAAEGQHEEAAAVMDCYAVEANNRGYEHLGAVASNVSDRVGSSVTFNTSGGYLRSMSKGMTRSVKVASFHSDALEDVQAASAHLGYAVSNDAQTHFSEAFTGDGGEAVLPAGGATGEGLVILAPNTGGTLNLSSTENGTSPPTKESSSIDEDGSVPL